MSLSKEELEAKLQAKMARITGAGGVQDTQKFEAIMNKHSVPEVASDPALVKKEAAEQINRIHENEASSEVVETIEEDENSADVNSNASNESEEAEAESHEDDQDLASEEDSDLEVPEIQKGVKNYAERKINKVTAKLHSAHDEIYELRQKLQELQSRQSFDLPATVPTVNDFQYVDPGTQQIVEVPKAENYGQNTSQYFEAMRNFEVGKKQALTFWQQQQKTYLTQQKANDNFRRNIEEVREKNIYRDFDHVVTRDKMDLIDQYQPQLAEAIKHSPQASHLLYGLCKNSELQQEFLTMNPMRALVELGKLEAEMELAMKPKVVSKAPPPISVKPSSGARKAQSTPKDASNRNQREVNASIKELMRRGR